MERRDEVTELRKQVDFAKLKAALHKSRKQFSNPIPAPEGFDSAAWNMACQKVLRDASRDSRWGCSYFASMDWASALCSLAAHLHGKMHAEKKWIPGCRSDGQQDLITRTLEDQAKIATALIPLVARDAEKSLEAELRRTATAAGL